MKYLLEIIFSVLFAVGVTVLFGVGVTMMINACATMEPVSGATGYVEDGGLVLDWTHEGRRDYTTVRPSEYEGIWEFCTIRAFTPQNEPDCVLGLIYLEADDERYLLRHGFWE